MTIYESFVVDKSSGTFADILVAYGLARLLYQLLEQQAGAYTGADVRLRDEGGVYRLVCRPALDGEAVEPRSPISRCPRSPPEGPARDRPPTRTVPRPARGA